MQAAEWKQKEQVLLDGDELARGKAFFHIGPTAHSSDHRMLAWLADEAGSEFYTARVRVIDTGIDLADLVPDVSSPVVWTHDVSAFFYVRLDKNHKPAGVFRHTLGTPVAEDMHIFMEADLGFFISIRRHLSRRFYEVSVHNHETSEGCSLIFSQPMPSRRLLPRANPAFSTKWNTIRPSMSVRH